MAKTLFIINSTAMKQLLNISIACILLFSNNVLAQTFTIGTGTSSNSNNSYPAPYGNYFWGAKQQYIYTAAELITAGATTGNITEFGFNVYLDNEKSESFRPKIEKYFERVSHIYPFIKDYHLEIYTHNSFPHSSGIASSASGMSALSLCIQSLSKIIVYFYDAVRLRALGRVGGATQLSRRP